MLQNGNKLDDYFKELLAELRQRRIQLDEKIREKSSEKKNMHASTHGKEDLKREALITQNLFATMRKTRWTYFEHSAYIISAKWLNKWKEYVSFDKVVQLNRGIAPQNEYPSNPDPASVPGPIDNEGLLLDKKEYFHNFSNFCGIANCIIRDTFEEKRDYYLVSKDCWDYLHRKYGGTYILKRCKVPIDYNGKVKLDIKFFKVNVHKRIYR